MATKIPGIKAVHTIITSNCRTVDRGNDPVMDAFDEAVDRLRAEYGQICEWRKDGFNAHVVLKIEGEREQNSNGYM